MRRIHREVLTNPTIDELNNFQREVDTLRGELGFNPGNHWQRKRQSQTILTVLATLKRMSGERNRCMYCVDSEGSDIEHFWPKSVHPERMYLWMNLLIACAQCGRFKGTLFPLSSNRTPLLINPTEEDPWDFLDFDPDTGNLNARYLPSTGEFSIRGENTVNVLHLDKREGVSAGYRKTYRRLCRLVTGWTDQHLAANYLDQLRDADDHGLLGWFLRGSGRSEPSFSRFRDRYQDAWQLANSHFNRLSAIASADAERPRQSVVSAIQPAFLT